MLPETSMYWGVISSAILSGIKFIFPIQNKAVLALLNFVLSALGLFIWEIAQGKKIQLALMAGITSFIASITTYYGIGKPLGKTIR